MKKEILQKFENRSIKLYISTGKLFTGIIEKVEDDYLEFVGKYRERLIISLDTIEVIEWEETK